MLSGVSPPKQGRMRLDELLLERGWFDDLKVARAWVMSRKVRVGGDYVTQPGTAVRRAAEIEVVGRDQRYVSRGGIKLEAALERFELDVRGWTALDAGASTGGFTDCLLQRGAARVYAVDVGFGQLRGRLAGHPRVVSLERTNVSDLEARQFDPPLSLASIDLSYLSLARAIPIVGSLFVGEARLVCLVKPLFEGVASAERAQLERFPSVFARVNDAAAGCGLRLVNLMCSPIPGAKGTLEFLAHVASDLDPVAPLDALTSRALDEAAALARA
jgi:23S rRNA (cytidine1920-2'-O)/16S rRNA (cytidine1409-2'-O)-methyltransferase